MSLGRLPSHPRANPHLSVIPKRITQETKRRPHEAHQSIAQIAGPKAAELLRRAEDAKRRAAQCEGQEQLMHLRRAQDFQKLAEEAEH